MEEREKYFCEIVEENCKKTSRSTSLSPDTNIKKIVGKLMEQMVIARYLHYG